MELKTWEKVGLWSAAGIGLAIVAWYMHQQSLAQQAAADANNQAALQQVLSQLAYGGAGTGSPYYYPTATTPTTSTTPTDTTDTAFQQFLQQYLSDQNTTSGNVSSLQSQLQQLQSTVGTDVSNLQSSTGSSISQLQASLGGLTGDITSLQNAGTSQASFNSWVSNFNNWASTTLNNLNSAYGSLTSGENALSQQYNGVSNQQANLSNEINALAGRLKQVFPWAGGFNVGGITGG